MSRSLLLATAGEAVAALELARSIEESARHPAWFAAVDRTGKGARVFEGRARMVGAVLARPEFAGPRPADRNGPSRTALDEAERRLESGDGLAYRC